MSKARVRKGGPRTESVQQAPERDAGKRFAWFLPLAIFCWPFVYLHSLVFIVNGRYRAIGNDFFELYYKHKVYLLDNLASFNFPLWSPAEAAGYLFYSNPFAQAFYPFNIPLALFYKIAGGYAPFDHQIFTVLGVAIFALGLFAWLRLINANLRAVLFTTLVMSVSFKITEILRFPNAVHTAAWYPWILYGLTRIIFNRSAKDAVISGSLLCFFLICLCTGGYPYYVYYSVFLLVPYLVAFLIRPLRVRLTSYQPVYNWKRAIAALILAGLVAGVICSPYFLATKNLMDQTADRGGKNYEYSVSHQFTFEDTVGSLVYPPVAQAEGWYFFSITALLIILLYLFSVRSKTTESQQRGEDKQLFPSLSYTIPLDRIFLVGWIGLISYITYGRDSYLFGVLWKYMPGFSRLRIWGRLNILLVPIIAWLLSLSYAFLEATVSGPEAGRGNKQLNTIAPLAAITLAYGAVLSIQLYFYKNKIYDEYWLRYFKHVFSNDVFFISYGVAAFALLLVFLAISRWYPLDSGVGRGIMLISLVLIAAVEMEHVGTRAWTVENGHSQQHIRLDVAKINEVSFSRPRTAHYGTISLGSDFNVGIVENWYFKRFVSFLKKSKDEHAALRILLGVQNAQKIFFSQSIGYATVQEFLQDALRYPLTGRLISYSGDQLRLEIDAPSAGYLSFIDNWDYGWKAFVDDQPAEMKLLFDTFKSVHIPPGLHRVTFSYQPGLFGKDR